MNIYVADFLRILIVILFGVSVGETAWIVRVYFRISIQSRRLLPIHVFLVGTATMLLAIEAVVQNVVRFGHFMTWYIPFNLLALTLLYVSLFTVRQHLHEKVEHASEEQGSS